jgi:aspartyl-tRNA(Asn)/glutamyl-tRNA(Gln) amidotransferase subunit B
MTDQNIFDKYEMTVGIECHVQLATKTKLFSGASNDARDAAPNTVVSPICFGLPGTLPVLNQGAVELAIRAGLALNSQINLVSKFDRKHYFYPDLPKGYQITQLYEPIVGKGKITVPVGDKTITVGITRAHLEEDAGKSTHTTSASLVDLNRAGTPLLEIVSEPDIHTPAQARSYAHELYLLMKYAGVSNVDLYQGNMRFDVNVSVAPKGTKQLGTRAEVKNLNSFRSVEKAAEYEFKRQVELLEKGQVIIQETRGWDDAKMRTSSQRGKENAHDYRYMPEPDVPPIVLEQSYVDKLRAQMPVLPSHLRHELENLGVDSSRINLLLEEPDVARFALELGSNKPATTIINWLTGDMQRAVSENQYSWQQVLNRRDQLLELAQMTQDNILSSTAAKELLTDVVITTVKPEQLARQKNLLQVSDESEIEKIVSQVLADNQKAAQDVKNGELKAVGFLVGQVMAKSKGQANPSLAQKLIRKHLGV